MRTKSGSKYKHNLTKFLPIQPVYLELTVSTPHPHSILTHVRNFQVTCTFLPGCLPVMRNNLMNSVSVLFSFKIRQQIQSQEHSTHVQRNFIHTMQTNRNFMPLLIMSTFQKMEGKKISLEDPELQSVVLCFCIHAVFSHFLL